jgi:hypothetical protein
MGLGGASEAPAELVQASRCVTGDCPDGRAAEEPGHWLPKSREEEEAECVRECRKLPGHSRATTGQLEP